MANIQVDEDTAKAIESLAGEQGITPAEYLKRLVPFDASSSNGKSAAQFVADLDELAVEGPALPTDFSRADIYSDHD